MLATLRSLPKSLHVARKNDDQLLDKIAAGIVAHSLVLSFRISEHSLEVDASREPRLLIAPQAEMSVSSIRLNAHTGQSARQLRRLLNELPQQRLRVPISKAAGNLTGIAPGGIELMAKLDQRPHSTGFLSSVCHLGLPIANHISREPDLVRRLPKADFLA